MNGFFQSTPTASSICIKPDKISLSDCLACSGCITSSESLEFRVDCSFLNNIDPVYSFILSPQTKKNISQQYPSINYDAFEKSLVKFLKDYFKIHMIVDTSYFEKKTENIISSECPAVVLYVERVFPDLIPLLDTSKTYQQIASDYIRSTMNEKSTNNHKTVSVMQCYDKKDELKRDNTVINHYIGSIEFYEFLKGKFHPKNEIEYTLLPHEMTHKNIVDEVCGLENCINTLNKIKNNINSMENKASIRELRICKNGCINGPSQINNTGEPLKDTCKISRDETVFYETSRRTFNKPKKKTFNVEW